MWCVCQRPIVVRILSTTRPSRKRLKTKPPMEKMAAMNRCQWLTVPSAASPVCVPGSKKMHHANQMACAKLASVPQPSHSGTAIQSRENPRMQHPEQMSRKAPLPLQVETSQLVKLCLAFFTERCCGTADTELTFVTSCRVMTGLGASALRDDVTLVRSCNEVG